MDIWHLQQSIILDHISLTIADYTVECAIRLTSLKHIKLILCQWERHRNRNVLYFISFCVINSLFDSVHYFKMRIVHLSLKYTFKYYNINTLIKAGRIHSY